MVFFSSTSALLGGEGEAAYAASKGAVMSFVRVAAVELAHDGIRVNCICPGWVDTPFNDPAWEFLGGKRAAEPDAVRTRVLRQAARTAEGWNGWGLGLESFRERVDRLCAFARDAGREPAEVGRSESPVSLEHLPGIPQPLRPERVSKRVSPSP